MKAQLNTVKDSSSVQTVFVRVRAAGDLTSRERFPTSAMMLR
jgi:hypothetical protein